MNITKEVTVKTSDEKAVTECPELVGIETPFAFAINYKAYGYAKFVIDFMSLNKFERGNLCKIKDSLTRMQIYYMLYHMVRFNDVEGSRAMAVIVNNLQEETAEDILSLVLNSLVPVIISKYLPLSHCEITNREMFGVARAILESGRFQVESTQQMIITSMIQFAKGDAERKMLLEWFNRGDDGVCGVNGDVIGKLTLKQKHRIVQEIYSATDISLADKEVAMAKLSETKSDLLDNTKAYCMSALPSKQIKRKIWDGLFGTEYDKLSLNEFGEVCSGFMQRS